MTSTVNLKTSFILTLLVSVGWFVLVACERQQTTVPAEQMPKQEAAGASEATMSGMPLSAVKFTVKEAEAALELVKYKAEYQLPPNANCERIWGLVGGVTGASAPMLVPVKVADIVAAPLAGFSVHTTLGELLAAYSLPSTYASPPTIMPFVPATVPPIVRLY